MKKYLLSLAIIFAVCGTALGADDTNSNTVVEEIVARVNNAIITRMDIQKARDQAAAALKQQGGVENVDAQLAEHDKDVLSDLIDSQLLLQKGDELGIDVQTDLIKRLDEIRKSMNLDSMEALEKAAQAQGVSYEDFKDNLKNDLVKRQVISREVVSKIQIPPNEAHQFYEAHKAEMEHPEQVHLAEILVAPKPAPGSPEAKDPQREATQQELDEAKKKADAIEAELKSGKKFEEVAKTESDGPTAAQGGDLGVFRPGTMAKELETVTFSMKDGEVSAPILTKQGYVILKVLQHEKAGTPSYKEAENEIMNQLYMEKTEPALRTYLTKLRENAFIEIKPGYVDSHAAPGENQPVYVAGNGEKQHQVKEKKKKFLFF